MRTMTKSAIDLVKAALDTAKGSLAPYSCKKSRKDFTQPQLFALTALRQFLKADYRKTMQIVAEWSDLRAVLGLTKVPHWTTIEKAHKRLLKKGASTEFSMSFAVGPESMA